MKSASCISKYDSDEGFLLESNKGNGNLPIILVLEDHKDYCKQITGLLNKRFGNVITLNSNNGLKLVTPGLESEPPYTDDLNRKIMSAISSLRKVQQRLNNGVVMYPGRNTEIAQKEEFIREVVDIIENNLNDSDFSVSLLCKELCMSRMQLHRKLKEYTGKSASEFIRSIRLEHAASLLKSGKMKVIEVMYEIGIGSCSYFAKAFKNQYKYTPSEYTSYYQQIRSHKMSIVK